MAMANCIDISYHVINLNSSNSALLEQNPTAACSWHSTLLWHAGFRLRPCANIVAYGISRGKHNLSFFADKLVVANAKVELVIPLTAVRAVAVSTPMSADNSHKGMRQAKHL